MGRTLGSEVSNKNGESQKTLQRTMEDVVFLRETRSLGEETSEGGVLSKMGRIGGRKRGGDVVIYR